MVCNEPQNDWDDIPLGVHTLTTSAYSPSDNGSVERVYNTMATILAMVCNEPQNDWDDILLGVHKLTTSAYSPSGNGGAERVYHTMVKLLAIGLQPTPTWL